MKTCIMCGEGKPYSEYYVHKRMKDGYLGRCKSCHKSEMKRNRDENLEYYKNYDARRFQEDPRVKARHKAYQATEGGSEAMRRARNKFAKENPEKKYAHKQVQYAVNRGDLLKPENCSVCGAPTSSRRMHGHHEDYSRPLDVVWMCVDCHTAYHKNKS